MRFAELVFDNSGQSQQLIGSHVTEIDGGNEVHGDATYLCWFRRARRAPLSGADLRNSDEDDGSSFVYWLIGEDGLVLTTAVYESGVDALIAGRAIRETDADYNARTNHGAY